MINGSFVRVQKFRRLKSEIADLGDSPRGIFTGEDGTLGNLGYKRPGNAGLFRNKRKRNAGFLLVSFEGVYFSHKPP